jgi:hypothetical protein
VLTCGFLSLMLLSQPKVTTDPKFVINASRRKDVKSEPGLPRLHR